MVFKLTVLNAQSCKVNYSELPKIFSICCTTKRYLPERDHTDSIGFGLCGNDGGDEAENTGVNPIIVLKYQVMCTWNRFYVIDRKKKRTFRACSLQDVA